MKLMRSCVPGSSPPSRESLQICGTLRSPSITAGRPTRRLSGCWPRICDWECGLLARRIPLRPMLLWTHSWFRLSSICSSSRCRLRAVTNAHCQMPQRPNRQGHRAGRRGRETEEEVRADISKSAAALLRVEGRRGTEGVPHRRAAAEDRPCRASWSEESPTCQMALGCATGTTLASARMQRRESLAEKDGMLARERVAMESTLPLSAAVD